MALDEVVETQDGEFDGHVYDLQSVTGLFSANSITQKNCRCYLTPVFKDETLVSTPDGRLAVQEIGGATTDLGTYADWFDNQNPQLQQAAVGERKYAYVRSLLGELGETRQPEWTDFIGPDGQPLTLDDLRDETLAQYRARKAEAEAAMHASGAGLMQVDADTIKRGAQLDVVHRGDGLPGVAEVPKEPEPITPTPEPVPVPVRAKLEDLPDLDAKPATKAAAIANRAILLPQLQAAADAMLAGASSPAARRAIEAALADVVANPDAKFWAYKASRGAKGLLEDALLGMAKAGNADVELRFEASTPGKSWSARNGVLPEHVGPVPPDDGKRPAVNAEEMLARLKSDPTLDAHVERFKAAVAAAPAKVAELFARRQELQAGVDGLAMRQIKQFEGMKLKEAKQALSDAWDSHAAARDRLKERVFDALRELNAGRETYSVELSGDDMADARQAAERLRGVVARPSSRVPGDSVLRMEIESRAGRANCGLGANGSRVQLDPKDSREGLVAVHEYGHGIEDQAPGTAAAAQAFLRHRTAGQPIVRLRELAPELGYEIDEVGVEDDFGKTGVARTSAVYMGKIYSNQMSEILSMGLENLARDPEAFMKDEEYTRYIVGVLTGRLQILPGQYQW